jgi:predicted nucleic acid-binding protein
MFLLDTNVVSEMRRPRPDLAVRTWVESKPRESQFLSVISLTEIAHGASAHPDPLQRHNIRQWLDGPLRIWFQGHILDLTPDIAEAAGVLIGVRQRDGIPLALADALLAATAMNKRLVLVTRNTKDFIRLPFDVYDPWTNHLTIGEQRR